ncbi:hypothetical protein C8F01DRAFT_1235721 [Mycena amicta]|nr:hypothetical protein C8F01DRAFT_1235721 [Mycena amicta]
MDCGIDSELWAVAYAPASLVEELNANPLAGRVLESQIQPHKQAMAKAASNLSLATNGTMQDRSEEEEEGAGGKHGHGRQELKYTAKRESEREDVLRKFLVLLAVVNFEELSEDFTNGQISSKVRWCPAHQSGPKGDGPSRITKSPNATSTIPTPRSGPNLTLPLVHRVFIKKQQSLGWCKHVAAGMKDAVIAQRCSMSFTIVPSGCLHDTLFLAGSYDPLSFYGSLDPTASAARCKAHTPTTKPSAPYRGARTTFAICWTDATAEGSEGEGVLSERLGRRSRLEIAPTDPTASAARCKAHTPTTKPSAPYRGARTTFAICWTDATAEGSEGEGVLSERLGRRSRLESMDDPEYIVAHLRQLTSEPQ